VETKLQKKLERKAVAAKNIQIFNLDIQARFCQYRVMCSANFIF